VNPMKSGFGRKLFRLFLLFSLVPAAVLTVLGYYLAQETTFLQSDLPTVEPTELNDYFREYLNARIDSALSRADQSNGQSVFDLDFLARSTDSGWVVQSGEELVEGIDLDKPSIEKAERFGGMWETPAGVLQYRCRHYGASGTVCGGYLHGGGYSQLLVAVQQDQAGRSTSEDLRSRYLYFLAVIFLLVGFVTVVIAYTFSSRLARSLSRPLVRLSAASKEIAGGKFGRQVEPDGVGEVRELIDAFNGMSARLEFTTTRLAQTERVAAWRHVAQRFAHELKNPLQPIMISLHRLEKMLADSELHREAAEPLRAASEELKSLVDLADRFSQLAKLPAPSPKEVDLTELVAGLATLYRDRMSDFVFDLELPDHPVTATIDPTYFREALHNLLQNAAEASAPGGRIGLTLVADETKADLIIEDTGAGMSPETVSAARLPYFTTKEKGKGLGLAVVEKVVTESGGRLFIDSQEGAGTKITITLPREKR